MLSDGKRDKRAGKRPVIERKGYRTKTQETSLDGLFERFYNAKVAEGMSARTLETYRENYAFICAYLDDCGIERNVTNVSAELIREYIAWMLNNKRKWDGHKFKRKLQ